MRLTSDQKRIEKAHTILQRLEDEVVGSMAPAGKESPEEVERIYEKRLESIHAKIWQAIYHLNEAYDAPGKVVDK